MIKLFISGLVIFILAGCSSSSYGKVTRVDPKGMHDTSMGFNSEDLHLIVQKMVSSMLKDELFDGTPVIDVRAIQNRTDEHIDTKSITDSIRAMIIKSKRARFVDSSIRGELIDELEYQNSSKYVDKTEAKTIGKHIAQGYMLDGSITSIKQRNSNQESHFYKFTLQLYNIETALIEWMDEKEIRKVFVK